MGVFEEISDNFTAVQLKKREPSSFYSHFWINGVLLKPDQFKAILDLIQESGIKTGQEKSWFLLSEGFMFTFFPNLGSAYETLVKGIELFRQLDDVDGEGAAQSLLTMYYKNIGQLEKAQNCVQKSIRNIGV